MPKIEELGEMICFACGKPVKCENNRFIHVKEDPSTCMVKGLIPAEVLLNGIALPFVPEAAEFLKDRAKNR